MVSEITSDVLTVHKLWYSLKYDRGMVMELEGDGDLRMFLKENDERRRPMMGRRGKHKRQRGVMIMASFVGEATGIGMICSKRVRSSTSQLGNGSNIVRNYGTRMGLCSYWVVSCDPIPAPVCIVMMKFSFACSVLASLLNRRQIFTTINHALQHINPWTIDRLSPWLFVLCL
ncbi:hypothetical protein Cgig2_010894 [Carnegiea gigantea]|uniref:Uncharacterized protein n=1 Tax=Carnegiea gigantea TaxID=171969 RepID=A0A9Q1GY96_9CARY|nr:hypothetical protein Cgig2_010894 [Carnegiea gigantea]